MRNIKKTIIHCSATSSDWMEGQSSASKRAEIKRWHVQGRGWNDIGYHVLIDRDGTVVEGRPAELQGAHVRGQNHDSLAVCLIGGRGSTQNDQFRENFTQAQEFALRDLLAFWESEFPGLAIYGHNQFAAKACPGFNVPEWLNSTVPTHQKNQETKGSLARFRNQKSAKCCKACAA